MGSTSPAAAVPSVEKMPAPMTAPMDSMIEVAGAERALQAAGGLALGEEVGDRLALEEGTHGEGD